MKNLAPVQFQSARTYSQNKPEEVREKNDNTSCRNLLTENKSSLEFKRVSFGSFFPFLDSHKSKEISPEKLYRKNCSKLSRFFLKQKLFNPDYIGIYEDKISALAVLDCDSVIEKYNFYNQKVNAGRNYNVRLERCFSILAEKELDIEGIDSLCKLSEENSALDVNELMKVAIKYGKFDNVSTKEQTELIEELEKPEVWLTPDQIKDLSSIPSLMRIEYFRDLNRLQTSDKMKEEMLERQKNVPVHSIAVDSKYFDDLFCEGGSFSYSNLKDAFKGVNLDRYREGMSLKYPRENFIRDFKNIVVHLSPEDRAGVFSYFKFNIDEENDIVGYPVPIEIEDSKIPENIKKEVIAAKKLVDAFILQNEIKLDEQDKKLENTLNSFIKAFPEFVSIIGKKHHRGDTIENHTLVVMQKCIENPMTSELPPQDQKVLFIATMLHDISKKQNKVDHDHPLYSAIYAKEIVKKVPISSDDKERIYELIKHSHWTTNSTRNEDMAAIFRRKNDLKFALILSKADTESAGFEYPVKQERIDRIYALRDKIYKNGIPIFASVLPDRGMIPQDSYGLKVIDFTDKNADLSKYGFTAGTKFSDLNFLCHSSTKSASELLSLCDDSKEICLSAILLNPVSSNLMTEYNKGCNVLLSSPNSNICLASSTIGSTGCRRGFEEFKQYLYGQSYEGAMLPDVGIERFREEIPKKLKSYLSLSDEEYAELYCELDSLNSVSEIKDVSLSNGKIVNGDLIKSGIKSVLDYLDIYRKDGKNEVVAFSPKVLAFVIKKDLYDKHEFDRDTLGIINAAKENDIPLVLV